MTAVLPPAWIGMLGGGQLGRYALVAARTMGYHTVVVDPDPLAPAGAIADEHLIATYDDPAAIDTLAARCAVVTTEFENPPAATLSRLVTKGRLVAPSDQTLLVCQDRRREKAFLVAAGVDVGPFAVIDDPAGLADAARTVRFPAILKTATLGYDGKGQRTVERADQLEPAFAALGRLPCVLEERLGLDHELSVIVARAASGEMATWAVAENHHVDGILDLTVVPARVARTVCDEAIGVAQHAALALHYVGVLAVELFVTAGRLLVNEMAPRPHNSGHWTLDASATSQFTQQVRAVCGLALGPTTMTAPAVAMVNLLGDLWREGEPDWGRHSTIPMPACTCTERPSLVPVARWATSP